MSENKWLRRTAAVLAAAMMLVPCSGCTGDSGSTDTGNSTSSSSAESKKPANLNEDQKKAAEEAGISEDRYCTDNSEITKAAEELLKQYKSQNKVERGFRFLKDPEFFADSIFVSKNEHIQALLMIMTLGLAVFSGLEWKLRNAMKTANVMLKSQTGKLTTK